MAVETTQVEKVWKMVKVEVRSYSASFLFALFTFKLDHHMPCTTQKLQ